LKNKKRTHLIDRKPPGTALLFVVIALVIMAILGAAMVSIYSDARVGQAVRNDVRRAYYMAESGYRYALSEILNSTDPDGTAEAINSRDTQDPPYEYTIAGNQRFRVSLFNLYGLETTQNISESSTYLAIRNPDDNAKFPDDIDFPGNLYLVVGVDETGTEDYFPGKILPFRVDSSDWGLQGDKRTFGLNVTAEGDDWDGQTIADNIRMLWAVKAATGSQTISQNGSLEILNGAEIFPASGGIVAIKSEGVLREYSYERKGCEGGSCTLYGLKKPRGGTWHSSDDIDVGSDDLVIFNSYGTDCYVCNSRGYSGDNVEEIIVAEICKHVVAEEGPDIDHEEFTTNFELAVSNPNAFQVGTDPEKTLIIGGGIYYAFGSIWYGGNKEINNNSTWCQDGECLFNRGLRIFSLVEFIDSSADGVTIALINAATNDKYSIGGDSALGELLAYAGDSRVYAGGTEVWPRNFPDHFTYVHGVSAANPNGTPGGLHPPKMAIEFDTWYNANSDWCRGFADRVNYSSRNDPDPGGLSGSNSKDYVQFIFWGENRDENYIGELYPWCNYTPESGRAKSYDDNKHDVGDNDRDLFYTYENLSDAEKALIPSNQIEQNNWLGTSSNNRKWALRFEVKRALEPEPSGEPHAGEYAYTLNMWLRMCTTFDCSEILDTEYARTWVDYQAKTPHLAKTIYLSQTQHDQFDRTLFGFTEATGGATQILNINNFELTFIRPGQRVVLDDPDWP
jgi:hypothetical protein